MVPLRRKVLKYGTPKPRYWQSLRPSLDGSGQDHQAGPTREKPIISFASRNLMRQSGRDDNNEFMVMVVILSTYTVECRVSILRVTILIWEVSPITVPWTLWDHRNSRTPEWIEEE